MAALLRDNMLSHRRCTVQKVVGHSFTTASSSVPPRRPSIRRSISRLPHVSLKTKAQASDDLTAVSREPRKDPFVAAGLRLERLVANTGDGEQELVEQMVEQEGAEFKLTVAMLYGSLMLLGSILLTAACHGDPWGGMSFSFHSFGAGLFGFLVGLPVAGLKLWSWSSHAEDLFPSLQDLHVRKTEQAKQWLSDLSVSQVTTVMLAESSPPVFLLFPTAQAASSVFLELYSTMLGSDNLLLAIPEDVIAGLSLALMSAACAVVARSELAITEDEYHVIHTAVSNSDRFYRLTATDTAENSSAAFKAVAAAWVRSRVAASNAAAAQSMATVLFLGVLWHVTGDLAAPLVAAAMVNGVDYTIMQRRAAQCRRSVASDGW